MASAFAKFKNQTYLEEAKTAADHYMADIGADEFFSTYELPMEAMACAGLATLAVGESAVMFADTASPSILKTLLNIKARAGCSRMTAPPTALGDAVAAHRKRDVSHRVVPAALVHDGVGVSWDTYFPLQPPHQPSQTALLLPKILGGTSSKWRCFFLLMPRQVSLFQADHGFRDGQPTFGALAAMSGTYVAAMEGHTSPLTRL